MKCIAAFLLGFFMMHDFCRANCSDHGVPTACRSTSKVIAIVPRADFTYLGPKLIHLRWRSPVAFQIGSMKDGYAVRIDSESKVEVMFFKNLVEPIRVLNSEFEFLGLEPLRGHALRVSQGSKFGGEMLEANRVKAKLRFNLEPFFEEQLLEWSQDGLVKNCSARFLAGVIIRFNGHEVGRQYELFDRIAPIACP